MNQKFCCKSLQLLIENPECPIEYISYQRKYSMTVPDHYLKRNETSMNYRIKYCPCCGTKFPENLSKEWWDTVKEQFNIIDLFDPKIKKLPKEFKTDQWWKNRGL